MRVGWLHGLVLGLSLSFAGCVDEGSEGRDDHQQGDSGVIPAAKAKIGPKGGVIQLSDKSAKVEIPAGALSKEIEVEVAEITDPPPFKMAREKAGRAFAFTPHGTVFDKEVTITVDFEGSETGVHLTKLDDDKDTSWAQVDSTPNNKQLVGKTKTFSIYCAARFTDADASAGSAADAASASEAESDGGLDGGTRGTPGLVAPDTSEVGAPDAAQAL